MKFILSSFLSLFTLSLLAQTDSTGKSANDSVTVIIHQDSRLDQLVKKQASINEITSRDSRRTDKGFRLMIISTTSRDEALAAKTKVYTYFPDLKA
jgi:hypothetical protein